MLGVKLNMATKGHPQTDGQSENIIRTLTAMLRSTVQKDPREWDATLSELEYYYNSTPNRSTSTTPFEVDIGRVPHLSWIERFQNIPPSVRPQLIG